LEPLAIKQLIISLYLLMTQNHKPLYKTEKRAKTYFFVETAKSFCNDKLTFVPHFLSAKWPSPRRASNSLGPNGTANNYNFSRERFRHLSAHPFPFNVSCKSSPNCPDSHQYLPSLSRRLRGNISNYLHTKGIPRFPVRSSWTLWR
jgi:hypothetical protein